MSKKETFEERLERCTYIDPVTGKRKIRQWLHDQAYEIALTINDNYRGNTNSKRAPCSATSSVTGEMHQFQSIKALREFLGAPLGAVRYALDNPEALCRGWKLARINQDQ